MKIRSICIVLMLILVLSACTTEKENGTDIVSQNVETADKGHSAEKIEETIYYKILKENNLYYYFIYNSDHEIIKSDGPINSEPQIKTVDYNLLRITVQTGTGIGTQWGYYYDTENEVFSQVFQSIYDESFGKVAYVESNTVVVRDIFDPDGFYCEISSFKEPFAKVAIPFTNVEFLNNADSVSISYLTIDGYNEVTEIFDL